MNLQQVQDKEREAALYSHTCHGQHHTHHHHYDHHHHQSCIPSWKRFKLYKIIKPTKLLVVISFCRHGIIFFVQLAHMIWKEGRTGDNRDQSGEDDCQQQFGVNHTLAAPFKSLVHFCKFGRHDHTACVGWCCTTRLTFALRR